MASRGLRVTGFVLKHLLRALWISTMVLTPLFGFWLASSLAAYLNATQWLALVIGLLLFPLLPVGWDFFFLWRRSKQPPTKQILTRIDRLVLRTLLINGLFLAVVLWWQPRTAFRSLAVRGDWMLDGHDGPIASTIRGGLLGIADTFERRWHKGANEYGKSDRGPDVVAEERPPADPISGWPLPAEVDIQVSDIPESVQSSPEAVGIYLHARITEPRRLIKAVHDFVALRLTYDDDALAKIRAKDYAHVPSQEAADVFAAHAGVCAGYSKLFVAVAKAAGLEAAYITGYARDSEQQPPPEGADAATEIIAGLEGYAHAWNAVKLDGHWYLVDVTWDDGKLPSDPLETTYLMPPAPAFGFQHLPESPAWQLVSSPLSPGDFVRQPLLTPAAVTLGLTLASPMRSQVTVDGELEIIVVNPRGATVMADVRVPSNKAAGGDDCTVDALPGAQTRLTCTIPSGQYEITMFAGPAGGRSLTYIGSVLVNSR